MEKMKFVDFYEKTIEKGSTLIILQHRWCWRMVGTVIDLLEKTFIVEVGKVYTIEINSEFCTTNVAIQDDYSLDHFEFDYIRKNGFLLYEYIRGSRLYGLDRPESDEDHGGVFIEPMEICFGTGLDFPEDINTRDNNESWFSLKKFLLLLLKSNPNVLESLFVPEDKILYKHPLMDIILQERDKFITKKCFHSFLGYAKTQIERARDLKKKITQPMTGPLKSCLEYILYAVDGDVKKVVDYLSFNKLKQEFCGLVNLDGMNCMYSMYYDWGAHLKDIGITTEEEFAKHMPKFSNTFAENFQDIDPFWKLLFVNAFTLFGAYDEGDFIHLTWERYKKPFGYKGLVNLADTSNQVRLSSIPKGELPLIDVSYNKDGYSNYCKQYHEYNDWNKHHNEERFNLAKKGHYDLKNACHSARLLTMGIEIARGEGMKLDRRNIDREFLMNIREGNVVYDDLMKFLESKDEEMKQAMANSSLPDEIDKSVVDDILIKIRKAFYGLH